MGYQFGFMFSIKSCGIILGHYIPDVNIYVSRLGHDLFSCSAGDAKEHTDPNSREFFVIKLAYQVYLEYQKQLFCDVDGESRS